MNEKTRPISEKKLFIEELEKLPAMAWGATTLAIGEESSKGDGGVTTMMLGEECLKG